MMRELMDRGEPGGDPYAVPQSRNRRPLRLPVSSEEVYMAARRHLPKLVLGIALALAIYLPAPCLAQANPNAQTSEPNADAPECSNLTIFPKLAASVVVSCQSGKSVGVNMPLKPDAQSFAREKSVRGAYEFREYR